jgi:hypothetical protein
MRVLLVHPSPLMYSEIYLRLEPLGLERSSSTSDRRLAGPRRRPPTDARIHSDVMKAPW